MWADGVVQAHGLDRNGIMDSGGQGQVHHRPQAGFNAPRHMTKLVATSTMSCSRIAQDLQASSENTDGPCLLVMATLVTDILNTAAFKRWEIFAGDWCFWGYYLCTLLTRMLASCRAMWLRAGFTPFRCTLGNSWSTVIT